MSHNYLFPLRISRVLKMKFTYKSRVIGIRSAYENLNGFVDEIPIQGFLGTI